MTTELPPFFSAESIAACESAHAHGAGVEMTSGAATDLFTDPGNGHAEASAAVLTRAVNGPSFQFSARVQPGLRSTFDAGALLVRTDDSHWAKLCLEQAVDGAPTAVSVVTRHLSDDANGWSLPGADAWMRISRDGETFAFHVSTDGAVWKLLRIFSLPAHGSVEIGVVAQSPMGEGCSVEFTELTLHPHALSDPRSGA
ncbi:DUF1349 domain-containing protein [Demequina sp. SO4-13]|uniref:DUF1349 domain-containing protein n=1 Tax=Demequina sp. SO4-13 TaxID=3401027 RepID=UPI003AF45048